MGEKTHTVNMFLWVCRSLSTQSQVLLLGVNLQSMEQKGRKGVDKGQTVVRLAWGSEAVGSFLGIGLCHKPSF